MADRLRQALAPFRPYFKYLRSMGLTRLARRVRVILTPSTREISVEGATGCFYQEEFDDIFELNGVESESPVISRLIQNLRPNDVFFDIGANLGVYSILAEKKLTSGQAVAFEPNPPVINKLRRNISLNDADIRVLPVALSDKNGNVELRPEDFHGSASIGPENVGTVTVECARGDSIIERDGIPRPSVLKIDVEGHELNVLNGFRDTIDYCDHVFCEVHDTDMTRLIQFFENHGFSIETIDMMDRDQTMLHAAS